MSALHDRMGMRADTAGGGNAGGCVTAAGFEVTGRLIQGLAGCSAGTGRKSDFHIGVAHRIWHDACV